MHAPVPRSPDGDKSGWSLFAAVGVLVTGTPELTLEPFEGSLGKEIEKSGILHLWFRWLAVRCQRAFFKGRSSEGIQKDSALPMHFLR